ncbi:hypothetical protein BELL_0057g00140 [Botrytis elliptica]|uniref:Uncharacterized protein n=1 Tax=Botrytis elliptica TaxID=278938 RepID=A0A4Z1K3X1_9HELO|nr:hypothetical protein BELL_0057g00140 [Botrytis elliptica]
MPHQLRPENVVKQLSERNEQIRMRKNEKELDMTSTGQNYSYMTNIDRVNTYQVAIDLGR